MGKQISRHFYWVRYFRRFDIVFLLSFNLGISLQMKPRQAVSIAAWIKLDSNKGYHSIFDTVGGHSMHQQGQYHFEIQDGSVRWFHRNETGIKIFSVETGMSAIDNSNESSRSALCYFFFCGIICSFGGKKLWRKYDEVRLMYCCEVYICFKNLSLTSP